MAVTVKLPTQLRDAAGGATTAAVDGSTVGEALNGPVRAARRAARAHRRRRGRAAPVRQRLPQGRGHPLPRRAGHHGQRRRRGHDPARRWPADEARRKAGGGGEPIVSFEFSPPRTVEAELAFWAAIEELAALEPAFVSVTCGAGGTTRDLTLAVVRRLARERGLEAVPHVTATGFTRAGLGRAAGRGARQAAPTTCSPCAATRRAAGDLDRAGGRRAELAGADRAGRRGRLLRARRRLSGAAPRLARLGGRPRPPAREARRRRARAGHPAVLRQRRLPRASSSGCAPPASTSRCCPGSSRSPASGRSSG